VTEFRASWATRGVIAAAMAIAGWFLSQTYSDIKDVSKALPALSQKVDDLSDAVRDARAEMGKLWERLSGGR
jgi:uncharacterized protein YukE